MSKGNRDSVTGSDRDWGKICKEATKVMKDTGDQREETEYTWEVSGNGGEERSVLGKGMWVQSVLQGNGSRACDFRVTEMKSIQASYRNRSIVSWSGSRNGDVESIWVGAGVQCIGSQVKNTGENENMKGEGSWRKERKWGTLGTMARSTEATLNLIPWHFTDHEL